MCYGGRAMCPIPLFTGENELHYCVSGSVWYYPWWWSRSPHSIAILFVFLVCSGSYSGLQISNSSVLRNQLHISDCEICRYFMHVLIHVWQYYKYFVDLIIQGTFDSLYSRSGWLYCFSDCQNTNRHATVILAQVNVLMQCQEQSCMFDF